MALARPYDVVRWLLFILKNLFVFEFIYLYTVSSQATETLRFVNIVYRHGDRSPTGTFPNDKIPESAWPQGFGQLSKIGMRQHFELGTFLRDRYKGFLSPNYTRTEICIRSTDVDRTLMSAASNLAGLFPPNGDQIWNKSIFWQPVPIHTVPIAEDYLLRMDADCPRYKQLYEERLASDPVKKLIEENQDFFNDLAIYSGISNVSFRNIWDISDPLYCELIHNFTLPSWATREVLDRMRLLADITFYLNYCGPEIARLRGGPLLGAIIKNMVDKRDGKESSKKLKSFVYSAHDVTVAALMCALNLFNNITPPYASSMLIELHESPAGMFYVNMLYRNNSKKPPIPLHLTDCKLQCPLDTFVKLTLNMIPTDWKKECEWQPNFNMETIIGISIAGIVLITSIAAVIIVCVRRRQSKYELYEVLKKPINSHHSS